MADWKRILTVAGCIGVLLSMTTIFAGLTVTLLSGLAWVSKDQRYFLNQFCLTRLEHLQQNNRLSIVWACVSAIAEHDSGMYWSLNGILMGLIGLGVSLLFSIFTSFMLYRSLAALPHLYLAINP